MLNITFNYAGCVTTDPGSTQVLDKPVSCLFAVESSNIRRMHVICMIIAATASLDALSVDLCSVSIVKQPLPELAIVMLQGYHMVALQCQRHCKRCNKPKPPLAHHCHICGRYAIPSIHFDLVLTVGDCLPSPHAV